MGVPQSLARNRIGTFTASAAVQQYSRNFSMLAFTSVKSGPSAACGAVAEWLIVAGARTCLGILPNESWA